MKLITISGLDGSGKSTQIKMLKSYLENQGKKVFYFHAIQFGLVNRISQKIKNATKSTVPRTDSPAGESSTGVTKASFFKIILRRIFLFIDLLRFKMLRSKLRNMGYNYILSDRYFYDSVINIEYLKNKCHPERSEGSRDSSSADWRTQNDIIKPDIALYLQTSPESIMQRERKPDQGLEYLQAKKILYDEVAPFWNLKIINGNRNKEEIFEEIKKALPIG